MNVQHEDELDISYDIADNLLWKIEKPTYQEVVDRLRDGHPKPQWVLKDRVPTTRVIEYFASAEEMLEYLSDHFNKGV